MIERQVLTPYDLEQRFGLIGGNIFQGEMSLDQLFSFRPTPELAGYKTPVGGLYLCGSGTHLGAASWAYRSQRLEGRSGITRTPRGRNGCGSA